MRLMCAEPYANGDDVSPGDVVWFEHSLCGWTCGVVHRTARSLTGEVWALVYFKRSNRDSLAYLAWPNLRIGQKTPRCTS